MAVSAGYDIGGAHLKVAVSEDGRLRAVAQVPCPLWKGIEEIDAALAAAAPILHGAAVHAATITGELCEVFPDRVSGIQTILDRLAALLGENTRIWMGVRGLGSLDEARAHPLDVASTNFLASAVLVARHVPDALLVDMGSTTTDIIPVVGGKPAPRGLSDGKRLRTGELVYTGTTRTDVSAVAQRGSLDGITQRLAAGGFANMADVRRVIGTLPDGVDQHPTLDGRGKSNAESLARLARCFGRDAADAPLDGWKYAARDIAEQQMRVIQDAMKEVIAASGMPANAPIIAAGIGAFEITEIAALHHRPARLFAEVANATPDCETWATRCAPATALALLAAR